VTEGQHQEDIARWGSHTEGLNPERTESQNQVSQDAVKAFPLDLRSSAEVFYWPLANRRINQYGRPGKLHAKAFGNKDQTIFPVEILNAHPVEFALISHSGIAHHDDDVAKEIACSLSPLAKCCSRKQFSFRGIIESE
jgi:hypothetical protein